MEKDSFISESSILCSYKDKSEEFKHNLRFIFLSAIALLELGHYACQETPSALKDQIMTVK